MILRIKSLILACIAVLNCIGNLSVSLMNRILFPAIPQTQAVQFVQNLKVGWNLGNTLDAYSDSAVGLDTETCWDNPKTTKEMIDFVKSSGFNTVRIPVTWFQHLGDGPDYQIDVQWLNRVQEIVDYVLDSGMYAILNVHHDDVSWLVTDQEHAAHAEEILTSIWAQVSERFKDYGEHLLFETMNEPRVVGCKDEWTGNDVYREVTNRLNSAAWRTIRNSGGFNAQRYIMITPYAASVNADNLQALQIPDDTHIIVSLHYYYGTAHRVERDDCEKTLTLKNKKQMYKQFKQMYDQFIAKGIPVIIGEFGWTDRTHLDHLAEKAAFYVQTAKKFGLVCIVWDDGGWFRMMDRKHVSWLFPDYVSAVTGVETESR